MTQRKQISRIQISRCNVLLSNVEEVDEKKHGDSTTYEERVCEGVRLRDLNMEKAGYHARAMLLTLRLEPSQIRSRFFSAYTRICLRIVILNKSEGKGREIRHSY